MYDYRMLRVLGNSREEAGPVLLREQEPYIFVILKRFQTGPEGC